MDTSLRFWTFMVTAMLFCRNEGQREKAQNLSIVGIGRFLVVSVASVSGFKCFQFWISLKFKSRNDLNTVESSSIVPGPPLYPLVCTV